MVYGKLLFLRRLPLTYVFGMVLLVLASCAGPQSLKIAIDPVDEDGYVNQLNKVNGDARLGFAHWMAELRGSSLEEVLAADETLAMTKNPFDAHKDPRAVSRGAVMYKLHCARCHGVDADGKGASAMPQYPPTSFKTSGKRFAAGLHRGAPKKWFRVISGGSGDVIKYPGGSTRAMPAFGDQMTREQIWLTITYLQSLDMHAADAANGLAG